MASNTDLGLQKLSFDYQQDAKSGLFNKLNYGILPAGIYSGSVLTRVSNNQYSITHSGETNPDGSQLPSTILIKDGNTTSNFQVLTKVEFTTTTPIIIDLTNTNPQNNPYIVYRFNWEDTIDNYVDILEVSTPLATDLILGKINFSGNNHISTSVPFDLSMRDEINLEDLVIDYKNEFRVQSSSTANKYRVIGGSIKTSEGIKTIATGDYPASTNVNPLASVSTARVDYLYIDADGTVKIEEGTAVNGSISTLTQSNVPAYRGRYVIAEIWKERVNDGGIRQYEIIRQYNEIKQGYTNSTDFIVANPSAFVNNAKANTNSRYNAVDTRTNYFGSSPSLQDVIDNVGQRFNDILNPVSSHLVSQDTVKSHHVDWGTATNQISAEDIPIRDTNSIISDTDLEGALAEIAGDTQVGVSAGSIIGDSTATVSTARRSNETIRQNAVEIEKHSKSKFTTSGTTIHGITIDEVL